ncbi:MULTISPECIES: hypothetical protein [Lactococcus]|uniref:Uncharacterized protein n=1 Tax=Lactococcus petauri TaxID=1940789 RepID=A0AAJ2IW88_9LACT|nr:MULTISPECIES: hypothetical protein [Lactococcus]KKF91485.1 hypothetical protein YA68_02780 [Lactococcus garvieae]MBK4109766.1 hypothetical protein [Lactococcus petauri]MCH1712292.1 hypothetical protein [Lactococcus petauri]MCI3871674.1 hypothetical protein [Lactococcus petauri]MCQ8275802.1 hypothetical protein [Lactococcus petauri]
MLYSILFFIATVIVILRARHFSIKAENFKNKYLRSRWFWGIMSMLALAIGILLLPSFLVLLKIPLIIFAVFAAMVFFEMTRHAIERAMTIYNKKNINKYDSKDIHEVNSLN